MTQAERRRDQRNQRSRKRGHRWYRVYRQRMALHLEQCRNPGCSRWATTFGHLIPHAAGGRFALDNLTLLCAKCNQTQANRIWPWLKPLPSEPEHAEKMTTAQRETPR